MFQNFQLFKKRTLQCPHCPKKLATEKILKKHITAHFAAKVHECPMCPEKFTMRNSLVRHIKRHSQIEFQYCEFCDKKFTDFTTLKEHVVAKHTDEVRVGNYYEFYKIENRQNFNQKSKKL